MPDYEDELNEIDKITAELYSSICFAEGDKPNFDKLRALFISEGNLINNNAEDPVIMNVDQFIEVFNHLLSSGEVKSFYEGELSSRTDVFGKIAHRFSTYEAKFDLSMSEPFCIGINSIQFIKINDSWFVSSMVWNDQTEDRIIPEKYL
jgi:hypothetical protein